MTGLYSAQTDSIHILCINGQAPSARLHDEGFQAVDIASIAKLVTKWATTVLEPAQVPPSPADVAAYTGLQRAAHLGDAARVAVLAWTSPTALMQQLIAAGAPLDHANNLHWTALIEAIVLGDGGPRHQRTVAKLLAAGANTQLADRQGQTPLQLARARGFEAMSMPS